MKLFLLLFIMDGQIKGTEFLADMRECELYKSYKAYSLELDGVASFSYECREILLGI
jgi:hypothetical protein